MRLTPQHRTLPEFLHLTGEYDEAVLFTCWHLQVYPDGSCTECKTFVTSCPGLDERLVDWPEGHRKRRNR